MVHIRFHPRFTFTLAFILLLALSCGLARADGVHIHLPENTIADAGTVSGYSSPKPTIRQPGNGAILYGIGGSEEGDNPCHMEFLWSRQNEDEHRLFTTEWHQAPCGAKRTKSFDETRLAIAPPQQALRAIKVCTNKKKNQRLKGVAFTLVSEITEWGGKLIPVPKVTGTYERANCAEWHKPSVCPTGHVAVGIKIYHDNDGASGLELICGSAGIDPQLDDVVLTEPLAEGEQLLSPIAGTAGQKLRVVIGSDVDLPNLPLRHYGIVSIMTQEDNDRPCRIALFSGVLDPVKGPDGRLLGQGRLDNCLRFTPSDLINPLSIGQGTKVGMLLSSVDHLEDHFINGVEVCDSRNRNNERIKGVGVHPVKVDKFGGVTPWKDPELTIPKKSRDQHAHCGGFSDAQYCPEPHRMVAVGVVMHHDGRSFTGMQLVCRRVKAAQAEPLKKDATGY